MTKTRLTALALTLAMIAPAALAQTAHRAWVSGHGTDGAGCGAPAAPCRSLQYAHDNVVAAGGEIDILDPAGYGAISITKAISIVNDGVGTAGVQAASGNAISISAASTDAVYLKGLNVDGVNFAGAHGVYLSSGGSLRLENCVISHFYDGVLVIPTTAVNVTIVNTSTSRNANNGIEFDVGASAVKALLDHVASSENSTGILVVTTQAQPAASSFAIIDSTASHESAGISIDSQSTALSAHIDRATLAENVGFGLTASGSAVVALSRSLVYGNGVGVAVLGAQPLLTGGDNLIDHNTTDTASATPFTQIPLQ